MIIHGQRKFIGCHVGALSSGTPLDNVITEYSRDYELSHLLIAADEPR